MIPFPFGCLGYILDLHRYAVVSHAMCSQVYLRLPTCARTQSAANEDLREGPWRLFVAQPSTSTPELLVMQRLVPLPARQLWGHAPRVRPYNRLNRSRCTFATVGAERCVTTPIHDPTDCQALTVVQTLRCYSNWRWPCRL